MANHALSIDTNERAALQMTTKKQKYDAKKLAELMLYVAQKCEKDPDFGAIKLNKVLFFAEFEAFMQLGHSLTGAVYQKLEHGPAPRQLLPIRAKLDNDGRAKLRKASSRFGGHEQQQLIALDEPDLSIFTGPEIALVDRVIDRLRTMNGKQVSELSHEIAGWKLAEIGDDIPYEAAFIPNQPLQLSPIEMKKAKDIANEIISDS